MKTSPAWIRRTAPLNAAAGLLALALSGCSPTAGAAVDPSCTPKHQFSTIPRAR